MMSFKAELSNTLSGKDDRRYVIVDQRTGEVLDDSQGYGYKSIQKAYEGYGYKIRSTSEKNRELKIRKLVSRAILENPELSNILEQKACERAQENAFLTFEDLDRILEKTNTDLSLYRISREDFLRYL